MALRRYPAHAIASARMLTLAVRPVFLLVLVAAGSLSGCQEKQDAGEKPKQKVAIVNRVNPVCSLDVLCGTGPYFWRGPDKSTVYATVSGAPNCPARLMFLDRATKQDTGVAVAAAAGQTVTATVNVPGTSLLRCACGPQGKQNCTCTITGVDPPLPPNVVMAPAAAVAPGAPIKDPAAGTVIPIGTPLVLS
jgi:hypothetical protein